MNMKTNIKISGIDQEQPIQFIPVPLPHPAGKEWMAAVWEDEEDHEDIIFLGVPDEAAFELRLAHTFSGLINFEHDGEFFVLVETIADLNGRKGGEYLKLHDDVLKHVEKVLGRPLRRHPDRAVAR
jgi:hypothetical protein